MSSQFDHPSPTPYLPRVRAFEAHDLPFTPYILNFMTTRVLEFGWTADYATLVPIIKPALKLIYTALGQSSLYDARFGDGNKNNNNNTSLCFADSIGELLAEVHQEITIKNNNNNN